MTTLPPSLGLGAPAARPPWETEPYGQCLPMASDAAWSNLLNSGAGNEARTRDLNLGKVALYQLSYSRSVQDRKEC
jgi:hypothetical protein